MTTNRTTNTGTRENLKSGRRVTVPFNEISEPGTYYDHDTGWLFRMPDESLSPGHSPVLNIVSGNDNYLTKISEDPWIPVGKAREICSNMDFEVRF